MMTTIPLSQVEILIVFFLTSPVPVNFCWFHLLHISVFCLTPCMYSSTAFVHGGHHFLPGHLEWPLDSFSFSQSVYFSHCSQFSLSLSLSFFFSFKSKLWNKNSCHADPYFFIPTLKTTSASGSSKWLWIFLRIFLASFLWFVTAYYSCLSYGIYLYISIL